jgi:hypothetical protein
MACLPKLQHRHGWFCHLIGVYICLIYPSDRKSSDQMEVPVFIIYAKQIPAPAVRRIVVMKSFGGI